MLCVVYIESISIHICISATVIYCILFAKEIADLVP